jgi:hypothetical protein
LNIILPPFFTETVTFLQTGEPAGSTVVFTPATASDSKEIIVMTIEEYSDSDSQDYSITMEGVSQHKINTSYCINVKGNYFSKPLLSGPVDGSDKQSTYPAYTWSADAK